MLRGELDVDKSLVYRCSLSSGHMSVGFCREGFSKR